MNEQDSDCVLISSEGKKKFQINTTEFSAYVKLSINFADQNLSLT